MYSITDAIGRDARVDRAQQYGILAGIGHLHCLQGPQPRFQVPSPSPFKRDPGNEVNRAHARYKSRHRRAPPTFSHFFFSFVFSFFISSVKNYHSSSLQVPDLTLNTKIAITSAYVLIFLIAFFGNFFGLLVVRKRSSSNVSSLFIANMAVADLIMTITVMPYQVNFLYRADRWFGGILGTVTCKAFSYSVTISIAASVLTMMLISFERFFAIYYPLRERILRRPKILSAIIWVLSFLLMSPYVLLTNAKFSPVSNAYHCWFALPGEDLTKKEAFRVLKIFHICLFVIIYALPLFITITIYTLICRKMIQRTIPGNSSDSNRVVVDRSRRKVVRLLIIICVVFALCWFPTYVNHFFWFVRPDQGHKLSFGVSFLFAWVAHANSAINPCLYILFNNSFRQALFALLRNMCRKHTLVIPMTQTPARARGFTRKAWKDNNHEHNMDAHEMKEGNTQRKTIEAS